MRGNVRTVRKHGKGKESNKRAWAVRCAVPRIRPTRAGTSQVCRKLVFGCQLEVASTCMRIQAEPEGILDLVTAP